MPTVQQRLPANAAPAPLCLPSEPGKARREAEKEREAQADERGLLGQELGDDSLLNLA